MGSTRGLMAAGWLGVLAACPVKAPVDPNAESRDRCPNPYTCTDPNGTGVYTAEDGSAGIGPGHLMILRFENIAVDGSQVVFEGRYAPPHAPHPPHNAWRPLYPGHVYGASYLDMRGRRLAVLREGLKVLSVTERSDLLPGPPSQAPPSKMPPLAYAVPTWTLQDKGDNSIIPVTGDDLRNLKLFISFTRPGNPEERYAIDFKGSPTEHPVTGDERDRSISNYWMQWTPVDPTTNQPSTQVLPQPYCMSGPPVTADSVVFQQGIEVDPVTGIVTAAPSEGTPPVTLSCYLGALATVFRWRYNYTDINGPDGFYFKAAIQMKRASYCGDETHYTVAGTRIEIYDTHQPPIHSLNPPPGVDEIEASWYERGAKCMNYDPPSLDRRRRPDLGFSGTCQGGRHIPTCEVLSGTQGMSGTQGVMEDVPLSRR